MPKAILHWSSGKDAALALYRIKQNDEISVERLLTTINPEYGRITMHGVPKRLLYQQAEYLDVPLQTLPLPTGISMDDYNIRMEKELRSLKAEGVSHSIFGDILLEDLKAYRDEQYAKIGMQTVFPVWKENTTDLIQEFIRLGFKTVVVCVNAAVLDKSFCGREINQEFLNDLPKNVDPCGENGEFHTFVYDGPLFKKPVGFKLGEIVNRSYAPSENQDDDCFKDTESWDTEFWFQELLPKTGRS